MYPRSGLTKSITSHQKQLYTSVRMSYLSKEWVAEREGHKAQTTQMESQVYSNSRIGVKQAQLTKSTMTRRLSLMKMTL